MYKRKIPKQQPTAAHAAVASQAAALAAFEEPNPFVRPGYQAADQVGGMLWGSSLRLVTCWQAVALCCEPHAM